MKLLKTSLSFLTLTLVFPFFGFAGEDDEDGRRMSQEEYIEKWKDVAVDQMEEYGIPASITLAQGILESGFGNSRLARKANNHFGIKCHGDDWDGRTFKKDDDRRNECFRNYRSARQSYRDHSEFLAYKSRYAFLFDYEITDYKRWARGLKKAGYATNPDYPDLLIRIIEENQLYRFDEGKRGKRIAKSDKRQATSGKGKATSEKGKGKWEKGEAKSEKRKGKRMETTVTVAHPVETHPNDIDFVTVKKGDSVEGLAEELDVRKWQIYKYNDLNRTDKLEPGDRIYLQPKRNRYRERKAHHVARKGETMRSISQKYGVKLKKLYKKNCMIVGTEPEPGQKIHLKGGKDCKKDRPGLFKRLFK